MSDNLTYRCRVKNENETNWLIEIKGGRFLWVPKRRVTVEQNPNKKKYDRVTMPESVAADLGLLAPAPEAAPPAVFSASSQYIQPPAQEPVDWNAVMERVAKAMVAVTPLRQKFKGIGGEEIIECPSCEKKLRVIVSGRNGHTRGQCETPHCTQWIE